MWFVRQDEEVPEMKTIGKQTTDFHVASVTPTAAVNMLFPGR